MNKETVTISKTEYEALKRAANFLDCLDAVGVDNWDGYDYARSLFAEDHPDEEDDD